MLQNTYLDAKIGVDPAEYVPSEVGTLSPDIGVGIPRAEEGELWTGAAKGVANMVAGSEGLD